MLVSDLGFDCVVFSAEGWNGFGLLVSKFVVVVFKIAAELVFSLCIIVGVPWLLSLFWC